MEKKLISEINRYREIVGLPRINEATISGSGLIGQLLGIAGFVDNVADEAASAAVKLETNAASDATGEIANKLARIQDELAQVAEEAAIPGARSSSIQDLIYVLKRSQDTKVKTDLIKVLNRYFDESNIITSDFIKNDKTLLGQIDKLDSKSLRDTLEETLGLQGKYLDEIISTFYKDVADTDVATLLKKLGISFDDVSTQTIRQEVINGVESVIANPEVKQYVKFISGKDGADKMKLIYNKAFEKISKMPGGITDANAEVYFNAEISKLIKELKDAGLTKDMLTKFNDGVKGVINWLTGYKNIQKTKGLRKAGNVALTIPRAYILGWGTVSVLTAIIAGGEAVFTSKESLLKQYLQTEEGIRLYNQGDMIKFNNKFNQWRSAWYQALEAGVVKFTYPLTQLAGVDTTPTTWSKEDVDKALKEIGGGGTGTITKYIDQLEDKGTEKGFKSYVTTELKGDGKIAKYDSVSGFYKFDNKDYTFVLNKTTNKGTFEVVPD